MEEARTGGAHVRIEQARLLPHVRADEELQRLAAVDVRAHDLAGASAGASRVRRARTYDDLDARRVRGVDERVLGAALVVHVHRLRGASKHGARATAGATHGGFVHVEHALRRVARQEVVDRRRERAQLAICVCAHPRMETEAVRCEEAIAAFAEGVWCSRWDGIPSRRYSCLRMRRAWRWVGTET